MSTPHSYSLTILVHPQATTKERDEVERLVVTWTEEQKGSVEKVSHEVKRKLAYPIQHLHQATYTTMRLSLPGENIGELEEKLRRQKKILRLALFAGQERPEGKTIKDLPPRTSGAPTGNAPSTPRKQKAGMEKLDEKIEEILEEEVL